MYIYQLYSNGRYAVIIDETEKLACWRAHSRDTHGGWEYASVLRICKIEKQKHGRVLALEKSSRTMSFN